MLESIRKPVDISELIGKTYEQGKEILESAGYYQSSTARDDDCPSADFADDEYWTLLDDDDEEIDLKTYETFYINEKIVKEGWNNVL